jgi:hypothetical protein
MSQKTAFFIYIYISFSDFNKLKAECNKEQTCLTISRLHYFTSYKRLIKVKVKLRPAVCRPVRLGIFPILSWIIYFDTFGFVDVEGALSDEKSGLYFSVFAGHRQRSLS